VAPRPYWKGYLKLALVSCPIALHSATSAGERVSFRQINKRTGNRLRQQLVDEATGERVEAEDKGRGYEYAKNAYIQIEDEEIEAIAIESAHTLEIDTFVPHAQIDERYYDSAYYITPNDQVGQEAFAVIREAMRGKSMVALARIVLAKRERVIMLQPWDKGIMATSLRYAYEVRDAKNYFDDIPAIEVAPDMLKLAEHILESKAGDFEPATFVDRYEEAVTELIKKKQAGIVLPTEKAAAPPPNVVNLMDALRRSMPQQPASAKKTPAATAKKGKKPAAGQREMLLAIAGKGAAKDDGKKAAKPSARQRKAG
jgi:DNA end-binding protein Ku